MAEITWGNMRIKDIRKKMIILIVLHVVLVVSPLTAQGVAEDKMFTNSLGMEFTLIPAGRFTMGSPPGEPGRGTSEKRHKVIISRPFYMQTTEVTVAQWQEVMGKRFFGGRKGGDNTPVVRVSWYDVKRFIKKINSRGEGVYRLPTDAEWEYTARAGSTTAYSWGPKITCKQAMYANNSKRDSQCIRQAKTMGLQSDHPAPVKSYPPNAWGVFDMHGNVWEWCEDRFDPDDHWFGMFQADQLTDPVVTDSGDYRIRRGGSWFGGGRSCRSANRTYSHPGTRYKTTGFRLVRVSP